MCAKFFQGKPISTNNIWLWSEYGYKDWLNRQEFLGYMKLVAEGGRQILDLAGEPPESIGDLLAAALASRYAELLSFSNDPSEEAFQKRLKDLRSVAGDIARMRRGDHMMARLSLARAKFKHATKIKGEQEGTTGRAETMQN